MPKLLIRLALPLLILIVAGGALWFVLTRPATVPETPQDTVHKETVREEEELYTIEASYPAVTTLKESAGISADAQAVATMRAFVASEIQTFTTSDSITKLPDYLKEEWGIGTQRKFALGIDYREYASRRTVSYLFDVYTDTGGAHPNAYVRSFTFDRATGEELSITDLFDAQAAPLTTLSQIARAELPAMLAEKSGVPVEEYDTSYIESGTEPVELNFSTFYLNRDHLVIVFSPYQVGPWALGVQELEIPREQLLGLKSIYR